MEGSLNYHGDQNSESGTQGTNLREVVENYKRICKETLTKLECDIKDKKALTAVHTMFDHLFLQNSLLLNALDKKTSELNVIVGEHDHSSNSHARDNLNSSISLELADANCKIAGLEDKLQKKNQEIEALLLCYNSPDPPLLKKHDQETETELCWERQIEALEEELKKKTSDLAGLREEMKAMDASARDKQWALAGEVKEKHDQVLKLQQTVSDLEERLKHSDKQTHFKEDIIKRMRSEIKALKSPSPRPEGPKLCDVVTEVTLQKRKQDLKMTAGGDFSGEVPKESADAGVAGTQPTEAVSSGDVRATSSEAKDVSSGDVRATSSEAKDVSSGDVRATGSEPKDVSSGDVRATSSEAKSFDVGVTGSEPGMSGSSVDPVGTVIEHGKSGASGDNESSTVCELKARTPREQVASLREVLLADIQRFETDSSFAQNSFNGKTTKDFKMADIGGGDCEVAAHMLSCPVAVNATCRDGQASVTSSSDADFAETSAQLDHIAENAKTPNNWGEQEKAQFIANALKTVEEYHLKDKCKKELEIDGNNVLLMLHEKQQIIENLQLQLITFKNSHNKDCSLAEKNTEYLMQCVDQVLQKVPTKQFLVENIDSSADGFEQKLRLLENTLSNVYDELAAERKLVLNKEEILQNLQGTVQFRENQVSTFSCKIQDLEKQLEEQKEVIAKLQQALQNSKKMEVKEKKEEIRNLRFEFCELEEKLIFYERECKRLKYDLDRRNHENCYFKDKLSFLETIVPRIKDLQEISVLYKEKNLELERDLLQREAEMGKLQAQVKKLEEDADKEVERTEGRMDHDAKVIAALKENIAIQKSRLMKLNLEYNEVISGAQVKYLSLKTCADQQKQKMLQQLNDLAEKNKELQNNNSKLTNIIRNARSDEKTWMRDCQEIKVTFENKLGEFEQKLRCSESNRITLERMNGESKNCLEILTKMFKKGETEKIDIMKKLEQSQSELQIISTQLKKSHEEYAEVKEKSQRVRANLEGMLKNAEAERETLRKENSSVEAELTEMKRENCILGDRLASLLADKERTKQVCSSEISILQGKYRHANVRIENLISKLQEYERQIHKLNATIHVLQMEASHANISCIRMRNQFDKVVSLVETKGKMEEEFSCKQEGWRQQDCLQEAHSSATGCDPWMPTPPAAHSLWTQQRSQLRDSSECFVESGFQSMMPSPVPTMSASPTCSHHANAESVQRVVP